MFGLQSIKNMMRILNGFQFELAEKCQRYERSFRIISISCIQKSILPPSNDVKFSIKVCFCFGQTCATEVQLRIEQRNKKARRSNIDLFQLTV